jgi:hypothetical protein
MDQFRQFLETTAHTEAIRSVRKLPAAYRKLLRGYTFRFQTGGTLKGDGDHIGVVQNTPTKKIVVASPWFYPREFALLHEIGHLVWAKYVAGTPLEKKWRSACSGAKTKIKQNAEEVFCHVFSQYYSTNKLVKFDYPHLLSFIRSLPK